MNTNQSLSYSTTTGCTVSTKFKSNKNQAFTENPLYKYSYGVAGKTLVKDPLEECLITFDFSPALTTESIAYATVSISLVQGSDYNPFNRLDTYSYSNGRLVGQLVSGGLLHNEYELVCSITTNNSEILVIRGNLIIQNTI